MVRIELIGHLGCPAELRSTANGSFISFSVSNNVKGENGEVLTEWYKVTLNGTRDKLLPYLRTGTMVFVRGSLSTRVYTGNDGNLHVGYNVYASEVQLCGSVRDENTAVNDNVNKVESAEKENENENEPKSDLPF